MQVPSAESGAISSVRPLNPSQLVYKKPPTRKPPATPVGAVSLMPPVHPTPPTPPTPPARVVNQASSNNLPSFSKRTSRGGGSDVVSGQDVTVHLRSMPEQGAVIGAIPEYKDLGGAPETSQAHRFGISTTFSTVPKYFT